MCVTLALVKRQPPVCQEVSYLQTYDTPSLFNQPIQNLRGGQSVEGGLFQIFGRFYCALF